MSPTFSAQPQSDSQFSDVTSERPGSGPTDSTSSLSYTSDLFAEALDLELQRAKSRFQARHSHGPSHQRLAVQRSHMGTGAQDDSDTGQDDEDQKAMQLRRPCVLWLQGGCNMGDLCSFKHDARPGRHDREPVKSEQSGNNGFCGRGGHGGFELVEMKDTCDSQLMNSKEALAVVHSPNLEAKAGGPTFRPRDPATTALALFGSSTGGKIRFKIRLDKHIGPRAADLDNREGGASIRLWLEV